MDYQCISTKCFNESVSDGSPCDRPHWEEGVDFSWIPLSSRTSFIIEFNMTCSSPLLRDITASIPIAGGLFGILIGGIAYDLVGPKKTILSSEVVLVAASLVGGTLCNSYLVLLGVRFFQGVGVYMAIMGSFILATDLLPAR